MVFTLRPSAHLLRLGTWAGLGTISDSSDIVRFGIGRCRKTLTLADAAYLLFTVSSGFRVTLDHFMMGHANVLLDREQSDHHAAFAPWIERVFPGMPYSVVLGPDREHQGAVACMAYFTTVEHRPDDDALGSSLALGWYVDHMDRSVRDIVRSGLDLCYWSAECKPMYWT